jgi:hypothetical protein
MVLARNPSGFGFFPRGVWVHRDDAPHFLRSFFMKEHLQTQIEQSLAEYLAGYVGNDPARREQVRNFPDWPGLARRTSFPCPPRFRRLSRFKNCALFGERDQCRSLDPGTPARPSPTQNFFIRQLLVSQKPPSGIGGMLTARPP